MTVVKLLAATGTGVVASALLNDWQASSAAVFMFTAGVLFPSMPPHLEAHA